MQWLDTLDKKIGRFAVPNLPLYIIIGQALLYFGAAQNIDQLLTIALIPQKVLQGEWYRLFSFIFWPPSGGPIFALIGWYIFWMMGSALEKQWGTFKFNTYLFVGYIATIAAAFFFPEVAADNAYLGGAVFLAFAALYPDIEFLMFFILPVKVKYLAWLTWAIYALSILAGDWQTRALVLASVSNFALFFGPDILQNAKTKKRNTQYKAEQKKTTNDFQQEIEAWNKKHRSGK